MERILVVEDEHIVALDIKMHLQKYGYEVPATYPSGEEALAHIEEIDPVLVLMDIRLQGQLDGLETAELIKERYNIPVILLTAYADDQTIERAKASQPFAYLIKPFEERELRTAIVLALFRHQMEQELIRRERLFSTTLNSIGDGVVVCDTQGIIDFINPVALQILGLQQQQCIGQEFNSVVVIEQKPREDRSEQGAVQHYLLNADSEWVPVEYLSTPLVGDKGACSGTVSVFRDVSSRLRAEADLGRSLEQFRQVQKMEAVGRLSGGIAHDFNNLLTVIMGYSRLIHQELKRVATDVAEDIGADLEGLDRAAQKSAILTRQLLTFSRRQVLQRKAYDLNEIVVDLEKMFRRLLTENVRLYLSCRAEPSTVLVDRGQMEQVLMNLVVNARDAMPGGGTLTVRTRNETVVGEMATQTGSVPEGNYVVLSVQDTGCGIQPQDLNRIFEPFFTTKDTGQGTGLGLSTVYGIISQSEGHIQVSSAVGEGTSFSIYMPLTEQRMSENVEEPGPRGTPGGNETLLLVEDDEAVRRMLARVLRDNGYTVIEAQNAGEALLIAEDTSNTLHMIVSDVVMPHVTGDRLVARIRSARPEIKALLISGYPESVSDEWSQQGWASLLLKPFEPQTLLERVRSVLDS
ncbi:MAG: response regulator [Spirochaetaceae bacterium]|nr:MAG: response regulator [Spirochaetaceae bacterium]